jgi:hypothetical protein
MDTVVENLEQNLLAPFRELAQSLCQQHPNLKVNVYSRDAGAPNVNPIHIIVIDCLLTDAPPDRADNIALVVEVSHLNAEAQINADVCWGHPSGYIEAEFSSGPVDASNEVLNGLYADLPRLYESLREAIGRRAHKTSALP